MRAVHTSLLHKHRPRGDAAVHQNKPEKPENESTIVKTYQLGNTKVQICCDHFAKTPEEAEKVIKDMHVAGWAIIDELVRKGEDV